MRRMISFMLVLLVICMHTLQAQQIDSVSRLTVGRIVAPTALIIVGSSGAAIGAARFGGTAINDWVDTWRPSQYFHADDYVQYVPAVAGLGLGTLGVKSNHGFLDRAITMALSYGVEAILVNSVKYTVCEMRPDGSKANSFPSGHSATAFCGAEIVRREYGWGYGTAAYLTATTVACLRMYNRRHWLCDVLAGAGIGILSADLGYALLHPTKRLFKLENKDIQSVTLVPYYDSYSGALCASIAYTF